MKRENKLIALLLVSVLLLGTIAACAQETIDIHTPASNEVEEAEITEMDLSFEIIPLTATPAMFNAPTASGTLTKANSKATIDYSNTKDGYIMVRYMNSTSKQLRVLVTGPSGTQYQYTLKQDATYDVYPLSDGNGKYTIGVYEQTEGNKYATAVSVAIEVTLKNEFAPFVLPNQYVNFTKDCKTVAKAADLVKDSKTTFEKIRAIYDYVINNLDYDKTFAQEVTQGKHSGYLPNVDSVLEKGKGICFDYAAIMTAMLRSLDIPTKLVIGYAGKDYHAWIDVYNEETGDWLNSAIFFNGEKWNLMDPTFASSSNQSAAVMEYIGDGSNYSAKYIY